MSKSIKTPLLIVPSDFMDRAKKYWGIVLNIMDYKDTHYARIKPEYES